MKKIFTLLLILVSVTAWSKDENNNDFSRSDSEFKALSNEELVNRFHITGEIFIVSKEGDKLLSIAEERREWQFGGSGEKPLLSNWRFQQNGLPVVALKHKWTLEKDGKISVEIAQYENIEPGIGAEVKYGKLIKEEKLSLKNFAPIDWVIAAGSKNIIVRLTPGLWSTVEAIDISTMPISGKNIVIYDKAGKLWADQVTADHPSVFFGVTTHQGSLFLSYKPFKGAKMIGEVKNGRIKIKNGKLTIFLQSELPFLPKDVKANVYGLIVPELKTEHLNSVRTYSSNKEEEFLKALSVK